MKKKRFVYVVFFRLKDVRIYNVSGIYTNEKSAAEYVDAIKKENPHIEYFYHKYTLKNK